MSDNLYVDEPQVADRPQSMPRARALSTVMVRSELAEMLRNHLTGLPMQGSVADQGLYPTNAREPITLDDDTYRRFRRSHLLLSIYAAGMCEVAIDSLTADMLTESLSTFVQRNEDQQHKVLELRRIVSNMRESFNELAEIIRIIRRQWNDSRTFGDDFIDHLIVKFNEVEIEMEAHDERASQLVFEG